MLSLGEDFMSQQKLFQYVSDSYLNPGLRTVRNQYTQGHCANLCHMLQM